MLCTLILIGKIYLSTCGINYMIPDGDFGCNVYYGTQRMIDVEETCTSVALRIQGIKR